MKTLGFLATICVVLQMALLSFEQPMYVVYAFSLLACALWSTYAILDRNSWLLATNSAVAGFAIYGLI